MVTQLAEKYDVTDRALWSDWQRRERWVLVLLNYLGVSGEPSEILPINAANEWWMGVLGLHFSAFHSQFVLVFDWWILLCSCDGAEFLPESFNLVVLVDRCLDFLIVRLVSKAVYL